LLTVHKRDHIRKNREEQLTEEEERQPFNETEINWIKSLAKEVYSLAKQYQRGGK
jgi:hypothetical protein